MAEKEKSSRKERQKLEVDTEIDNESQVTTVEMASVDISNTGQEELVGEDCKSEMIEQEVVTQDEYEVVESHNIEQQTIETQEECETTETESQNIECVTEQIVETQEEIESQNIECDVSQQQSVKTQESEESEQQNLETQEGEPTEFEHEEVDNTPQDGADEFVSDTIHIKDDGHHTIEQDEESSQVYFVEESALQENENKVVHTEVEELIADGYIEDDEMETSEIILCVDTSVTGPDDQYEIIEPSTYMKEANANVDKEKPKVKPGPAFTKRGVPLPSPTKMVKLTYGSHFISDDVTDIAEDSGNVDDESDGTKLIQYKTQSGAIKVIQVQNSAIRGMKRGRDDITIEDGYEVETEYDVDQNGVVIVRKGLSKKKPATYGSTTPKSIACYYCNFRANDVDAMEVHLSSEHYDDEDEKINRKRLKKKSKAVMITSDQTGSEEEDASREYDMLDETRESKNPNFECWRCNNRRFAGSGSLRRHINAVHLRLGNHPCNYCGKLFSAKHNLKVHTQTVHLRQRNYVCVFCNRTYTENRSLKRHLDSTHAGQGYAGMEYLYVTKEKGRPRSKPEGKSSEKTQIVYRTQSQTDSYDTDDQAEDSPEAVEIEEDHEAIYVLDAPAVMETKSKPQVVIYHDDSISASEEVVVGGNENEMPIANEEVVITNNVDVPVEDNEEMETIEIKVEVNGNQEGNNVYNLEQAKKSSDLIVYDTGEEELVITENEVVVSNEDQTLDESQVTIYINGDGPNRSTSYQVNVQEEVGSTSKRKPYQRIKCGYCGDFFCSRQLFYKHANKIHRERLLEDWHSCNECKRFFPSAEAVKLHCSLIHANENKRTECPFCATLFTRTCTYYRHANQAHLEIISKDWILCNGCDLYMPDADKLRQHQVHAHPPRKHK